MLGDFSCRVLLNIFGYLWPAYKCYKVLGLRKNDMLRDWCIYWFVLALFTAAERLLLDGLLFWVPMYYEAKLMFVIYLWHPQTQGALFLYNKTLLPFLQQHEALIDQKLEESTGIVKGFVATHFNNLIMFVQSKAHIAVAQLQQLQNKQLQKAAEKQQDQVDMPTLHYPNPQNASQAALNAFYTAPKAAPPPPKPSTTAPQPPAAKPNHSTAPPKKKE